MNLTLSYRHVEKSEFVEQLVARHLTKLSKLLETYAPELVHLHGTFDRNSHKAEYFLTLNLGLPTGHIHVTGKGPNLTAAVRQAFVDLRQQFKKHMSKLRGDYEWKRKRPARPVEMGAS